MMLCCFKLSQGQEEKKHNRRDENGRESRSESNQERSEREGRGERGDGRRETGIDGSTRTKAEGI